MGLLFTYLMTYGGSAISLVRPFYGLLIYICFAIIKPPALWHWSVPAGNHSRIIAIGFLLGWALNGFGDRQIGKAKPILYCLLGYWLWVTLSTINSPAPELGTGFIENLAKIAVPFIAGLTLINSVQRLRALIAVIVVSCGFLAYEANLAYLNGLDFANGRFLFLDNNSFSILMVTGFGAALVYGFVDTIWWRRWACFGMAAAMAHVPMLSMSRGGMVGALAAAGTACLLVPKTPRTIRLILAAVVVGVVLAGPSVIDEFSTTMAAEEERDASAQSRVDLWRDCTDAMVRNPIFGIGQERWGIVAVDYGWNPGKEAHSLWFQTGAELGIPGLGFLLTFYLLTCWKLYRLSRDKTVSVELRNAAMACVAAIGGFGISASFVTVEGFELPFYVVLFGAATLKIAAEQPMAVVVPSPASQHPPLGGMVPSP